MQKIAHRDAGAGIDDLRKRTRQWRVHHTIHISAVFWSAYNDIASNVVNIQLTERRFCVGTIYKLLGIDGRPWFGASNRKHLIVLHHEVLAHAEGLIVSRLCWPPSQRRPPGSMIGGTAWCFLAISNGLLNGFVRWGGSVGFLKHFLQLL
ncbi:hypothetical protein N5C66_22725 [Rhizobium pusense]|uniref:hypothetical protein n=1 Tax=Agrobacterium pusense TaxID=648995 RepID=UPI00130091D0|nr:hypothetical protein [Agrobacterium pusense]MDH0910449.1 hypothetical protein [Agrobacterium pusense]MDH1098436.1 hypothetical protein [Agrobacterium pusense]MDH1114546.1 hypothetical protein [Agrobacterium pusense]MDH2195690.1 hypothetical protein [Agrobacterium pusense]